MKQRITTRVLNAMRARGGQSSPSDIHRRVLGSSPEQIRDALDTLLRDGQVLKVEGLEAYMVPRRQQITEAAGVA